MGLAGGLNPTNVAEAIARTGRRWSIPPAASKARRASGYRQDYQFRLCGALGLNRVDQ
nr:Phosphoribosylanthranilate isomerase [Escherichia coli]